MLIAFGRNGQISFDGEWLTFVGVDAIHTHISQITGTQLKMPSLTAGLLRFDVDGPQADNSLTFNAEQADAVVDVRNAIEQARVRWATPRPDLAAAWETATPPSAATQPRLGNQPGLGHQPGLGDQLALVVKLWDEGALTGEEFAEAKRRLLTGCTCGSRAPVQAPVQVEVVQGRPMPLDLPGSGQRYVHTGPDDLS